MSNARRNPRWLADFRSFTGGLLLILASCSSASPTGAAPQLVGVESAVVLTAKAFCGGEGKHPRGVLSLTWRARRKDSPGRERIDVTAHKNGFERELFATLEPVQQGRSLELPDNSPIPQWFYHRSLALRAVRVERGRRVTTVELEGLEPGLNYSAMVQVFAERAWIASNAVVVSAPVCLFEGEEENEKGEPQ